MNRIVGCRGFIHRYPAGRGEYAYSIIIEVPDDLNPPSSIAQTPDSSEKPLDYEPPDGYNEGGRE